MITIITFFYEINNFIFEMKSKWPEMIKIGTKTNW